MCHIRDLLELHKKTTKKLKLTQQDNKKVSLGQLVLLLSQSDLVDLRAVPSFEVRMLEPGNVYVIPPCMVMQEYSVGHSAVLMFARLAAFHLDDFCSFSMKALSQSVDWMAMQSKVDLGPTSAVIGYLVVLF